MLERIAYLNAGTTGPIPRRAADAARAELADELASGRSGEAHWERMQAMDAALRERVAALLGCEADELALTRSTTDGVNSVVAGLGLRAGDEVLTSDEEHPGLLAPLAAAARRDGIAVRTAPFAELAGAVSPATRLVACSHVSWISGRVADTSALAATGVPVLLDGAQGLGAVPVDVRALRCDFYAASGQKWLCGPDASGYLYVRSDRTEDLAPPWPGYGSLADPQRPLALDCHAGARRFDQTPAPRSGRAWAIAAFDLLAEAGWEYVLARGPALAARLAAQLEEAGKKVAPRDDSTLVAWPVADAKAEVARLREEGFVVRDLPGRGLVRASVGAWSGEDELERLVATSRS